MADEAPRGLTIYGQEKDNATWALARMNMILHGNADRRDLEGRHAHQPAASRNGRQPEDLRLRRRQPAVLGQGVEQRPRPEHDEYGRFEFGVPPAKNGDYAFLLHILKSLKSTGKGAVILPHGVLFRGNAEATIRTQARPARATSRASSACPPNLFYGTGIPACIVVLDKENAQARTGIFMIDAIQGLHEGRQQEPPPQPGHPQDRRRLQPSRSRSPRYSRMVPLAEIASQERLQPQHPALHRLLRARGHPGPRRPPARRHPRPRHRRALDRTGRSFRPCAALCSQRATALGTVQARVPAPEVRATVLEHPEFAAFRDRVQSVFDGWREAHEATLRGLDRGSDPKALIGDISEDLLARFGGEELVSRYDVYQHLMDYWAEEMQDDVYAIAQDGWEVGRVMRPRPRQGDSRPRREEGQQDDPLRWGVDPPVRS